jgi:glutamate synthase (NADPH/NADH) small chain
LGRIELRTGVEVVKGPARVGQVCADDLVRDYDAVFLGLGLGADSALGIPGEEGPGVHGAVKLIEQVKAHPQLSLAQMKQALVVGGGTTAIDIAHELSLLGLDVAMVYRRGQQEMSGYAHEMKGAREHGVRLIEHRQPVSVVRSAEGAVIGLEVSSTRPKDKGATETLPTDLVAVAIGQSRATQVALAFPGVELDGKGWVVVNPKTHRTGHPKVWSGGDCVNGGKEVVNAAAEAKVAVRDIHHALTGAPYHG